ncbi:MAG: glycosyltransferase family 25 protein [Pseudomonadota bacterium]
MQTFVINLDRDTARMADMAAMLEGFGAGFERLSAITPETLTPDMRARFKDNTVLSGGEIGCFVSHLTLHETIAAGTDPWYLILEDDVALTQGPEALRAAAEGVSADVIKMEYLPKSGSLKVADTPVGALVRPWKIPLCTAAMLISPQGARKILKRARGIDLPYDHFLRELACDGLDVLNIVPPPLTHLEVESSIDPAGRRARQTAKRTGFDGEPTPRARWRDWTSRFGTITTLRVWWAHCRYRFKLSSRKEPQNFIVEARG